jgi:hypothetical protein
MTFVEQQVEILQSFAQEEAFHPILVLFRQNVSYYCETALHVRYNEIGAIRRLWYNGASLIIPALRHTDKMDPLSLGTGNTSTQ